MYFEFEKIKLNYKRYYIYNFKIGLYKSLLKYKKNVFILMNKCLRFNIIKQIIISPMSLEKEHTTLSNIQFTIKNLPKNKSSDHSNQVV